MIPEYKLYHGAVLAELADQLGGRPFSIRTYGDSRRLLNYVLVDVIGLQIKVATQRLHPWQFTFPEWHVAALSKLTAVCKEAFLVLVCHTDGMICVPAYAAVDALKAALGSQGWLRADRQLHTRYRLYGPTGEFPRKMAGGLDPLVEAVRQVIGE